MSSGSPSPATFTQMRCPLDPSLVGFNPHYRVSFALEEKGSFPLVFLSTAAPHTLYRGQVCFRALCICAWTWQEDGGQQVTLEAGYRLPTQSKVRNHTGIFCAIFPLAKHFFYLTFDWVAKMHVWVGWAHPRPQPPTALMLSQWNNKNYSLTRTLIEKYLRRNIIYTNMKLSKTNEILILSWWTE